MWPLYEACSRGNVSPSILGDSFKKTLEDYADVHFLFYLFLQYEKAASILSRHDPSVALAKVDASEENNRELATKFEIHGFPTIKILRNGGKTVQDYKGPREADGIVEYLKKQSGPPSTEIKSVDDANVFIGEKKVVIVSGLACYMSLF